MCILREGGRWRWRQLALYLGTARAKACQVALFKWQGADNFRVNAYAIAPAGLSLGLGVCHGAVVAGAAGGANVGGRHVGVSGKCSVALW